MVWPFSNGGNDKPIIESHEQPRRSSERITTRSVEQFSTPSSEEKQLLLEDTQPRFYNGPNNPTNEPMVKQAINSISLSDFQFSNLVKIPCFRDAGLTGLSSMFVLGSIIFITQKSVPKAINWSIGGLLLGSTISWEQCRSKRRREFEFTQKAKDLVAQKEKPMVSKPEIEVEKREEVSSWWKR
ncbi:hypothetical protein WICMUC_002647 [Wickerhamomyces mucosus]|uniref:Cytochrome c oxidase assembly protein COX20, mitochondrial n=1 Tax=Wickerhamomyces mucosus TaxID=1378264 RepID=A0A9P8TDJ9_9ASCO|nr:hypothetical protein WICMUC_002647 [Wickerhamomyces mucosus]